MKRFIPILTIAAILFASCEYEPVVDPYANFQVNYNLVEPGELVAFYNMSEDASYYRWDFGDGTVSNQINPTHYYNSEGIYEVTLEAHKGDVVDYAHLSIEVSYVPLVIMADYNLVQPGEVVVFSNSSEEASSYRWDFGDGAVSSQANPTHYYNREGVYKVTLEAKRGNSVDYAYYTVTVNYTSLEIEVRDYVTDELVPRLNAVLYPSHYDYLNFGIETGRGVTDYDGVVAFTHLNTQRYYIELYNNTYHNDFLAADDVGFIETHVLAYAQRNVFVTYVDYDPMEGRAADRIRVVKTELKSTPRSYEQRKELKDVDKVSQK